MSDLQKHAFADIVGKELKDRRKSIRWLALRAGMNDSYLGQLLREKVENPSLDIALRLFVALKINPTEYARAAGYLPPFDREKLPDNLQRALLRDDWPDDIMPWEIELLADLCRGNPRYVDIAPRALIDILLDMRRSWIAKIGALIKDTPDHLQEVCHSFCDFFVRRWREGNSEKSED